MEQWVSENLREGREGGQLSISGIATYQPFDGMTELKVVMYSSLNCISFVLILLNVPSSMKKIMFICKTFLLLQWRSFWKEFVNGAKIYYYYYFFVNGIHFSLFYIHGCINWQFESYELLQ